MSNLFEFYCDKKTCFDYSGFKSWRKENGINNPRRRETTGERDRFTGEKREWKADPGQSETGRQPTGEAYIKEAYIGDPGRSYEFANAGGTGYGPILGSDLQEPIQYGATVSYLPNKEGTYKLSDWVEDTWFAYFSYSIYRGLFQGLYTTLLMDQQYILE